MRADTAGGVGLAECAGPYRNDTFAGSVLATIPGADAAPPVSKNRRGGNGFIVAERDSS
ncbi:hypothetical protein [Burkholderia sp. BCC1644]|uniref:hypothetical protein n=1 Tax=Burkholderia sp. BCC1644 TaxID=2676293 RepID=UPI001591BD58|nr:hypothetical protein [Burkholderia sp. BCC1644]